VNPTRSSSRTADATAQDKGGLTPLDYVSASSKGTVDLARFLLEHGAEETALSTPPHQASSGRNVDLARFLIEHGAFARAEDEDGSTPLHQVSVSSSGNVYHGISPSTVPMQQLRIRMGLIHARLGL